MKRAQTGTTTFAVAGSALIVLALVGGVKAQDPVDLSAWTAESYPAVTGFLPALWTVQGGNLSVLQERNGQPTLFYSDFPALNTVLEGRVIVSAGAGDNDYIGFALGFQPGDSTNPSADYLLVDWKHNNQSADFLPSCTPESDAYLGLAVSRVFGIPTADEFWGHINFDADCSDVNNGVEELARGFNLGNTYWVHGQEYSFRFEYSPNSLKVFVDDVLEIDVQGSFDDGRFACYNFSQQLVTYSSFVVRPLVVIDIMPGSCPNSFNPRSHGVLPVAIIGTDDLDVTEIDVSSVVLSRADGLGGEVGPNEGPPGPHSVFEDVATPFDGEPCDCHHATTDGVLDLSMKFRTDDVVAALGLDVLQGQVEVVVSGMLLDGTEFTSAADCLRLVP